MLEEYLKANYYARFHIKSGIKSGICLLIVPVPVHCFSLTFIFILKAITAEEKCTIILDFT